MVEPPLKKRCIETNFELCIKCQISTNEPLRTNPKETSYATFLNSVRQLADYNDDEFIPICERLHEVTVDILKDKAAKWHSSCYSSTTHNKHFIRARHRYERTLATKDIGLLKRKRGRPSTTNTSPEGEESSTMARPTRSQISKFDRKKCFFCQHQIFGHSLHQCSSTNIGKQLSDIITNSNVVEWKVNYDVLCENDALSRDIMYHKICMTRQWKKYCIPKHEAEEQGIEETVAFIAAEMQFYSQLNDSLSSGAYISIDTAVADYIHIMDEHSMTGTIITRRKLKEKITRNIENVEFTRPYNKSKATLIHSTAAQDAAVGAAAQKNGIEEVQIIFQCAQSVRKAIEQYNTWIFTGSLIETKGPAELAILLRWIIQGQSIPQTEVRANIINRSCNNLAQQIIHSCKSKRQVTYKPRSPIAGFRNTTETPLTTGMSLHCYHSNRSRNMINLLTNAGMGASYKSTLEHVSQIAGEKRAPQDEIDEQLVAPFKLSAGSSTFKLKNVPLTGVELLPCNIIGAPKPKSSPHYPGFKVFQHMDKLAESEECITAWLLGRFFDRQTSKPKPDDIAPAMYSLAQPVISKITDTNIRKHAAVEQATPGTSSGLGLETQPGIGDVHTCNTAQNENLLETSTLAPVGQVSKQCIPVWAAYNSIINTEPITDQHKPLDQVHALPLIKAPAHEWQTLTTSLLRLHNLNQLVRKDSPHKPVCVWLDMDLYKRVVKLAYLDPSEYANKWIESPRQLYTVLCALRCLGQTVDGSGLDEAWVQADMYSHVTVMQIMNGKHYNRALECHQVTLQVLTDLFLEAIFQKNPSTYAALKDTAQNLADSCRIKDTIPQAHQNLMATITNLNIKELIDEFDATNDKYPVYKWIRMYMRQVTTMLSFLQATRQQQWDLHLSSLEQLCVWFFAYNRLDYAQHVPEYIARMYHLQHSRPDIWDDFAQGNFTVKTTPISFTAVGVDQAQEHVNKRHKGDGGVSGITTNPEALMRYCLSTPELTRLSGELEGMLGISKAARSSHHHMTESKVNRQEKYIRQLKKVLSSANPFTVAESDDGTELKLFNLMTKVILPENVAESILETESRGKNAYRLFVEERLCGKGNLWEKMNKVKVLGWSAGCKAIKTKIASEQVCLRASNSVIARLLVIARSSREFDMKEVIGTYELSTTNPMVMTPDGRLHPCQDKAQLLHELEHLVAVTEPTTNSILGKFNGQSEIPDQTCILFDAMAVVNELVVFNSIIKNCNDLAKQFVHAINLKSREYVCSYVVFDDYSVKSSLKDATRKLRTGGKSTQQPCYKVEDATSVKDFTTFISSTKTKDLLTLYLSQKLVEHANLPVTTVTRLGVQSNQQPSDFVDLQSTQEEADTILILYAAEVQKSGLNIHIYSSDTDVLVLAISTQPYLGSEATLIMGTGENRRFVRLQPIYNALGKRKVLALRGLHAMSGCDTTGHIHGKSKTAWWNAFLTADTKVINALVALDVDDEPSEKILTGCEELVCQLFNTKRTTHRQAKELRWSQFLALKANHGTEKLPPTQGAINEHTRRAHLQSRIWHQVLVATPSKLDATGLGWSCGPNDELTPVLSRLPPAPESLVQLVKCSCQKSQCRGRCTCRNNNVNCTELCKCESSHEMCTNIAQVVNDSDSDSEYETEDE